MKRSSCHDKVGLPKTTERSRLFSPSRHDEDELQKKTKTSRSSYNSSPGRYHYEYELSEDNSIVDPPESTVLDLVSTVRINFRVNYILRKRKRNRTVDETLDSIERCFYMRLYLITGIEDYSKRHKLELHSIGREYCQLKEDEVEYDVNWPETFLSRLFICHGVVDEDDVIKKLIGDIKDFVNRKRTRESRVLPIAITLKVYTLQQEDETIDDAKQRAITTNLSAGEDVDKMIKLLQMPPPYKFMIEFDDDHEMLRGDCCICLSKLSVGEEVLLLSCSHAYHYNCLIRWREKGKQEGKRCPLCRCPMNLSGFIHAFRCQLEKLNIEFGEVVPR